MSEQAPRSMQSSCKNGYFMMSWPEDISTDDVGWAEEMAALQFKTIRRLAEKREADVKAPGDLEYESWFAKATQ